MIPLPAQTSLVQEVQSTAARTAPAVGVIAAQSVGWGLQEWVFVATLIYLFLQGLYLVFKFVTDLKREQRLEHRRHHRQPQDE